jgi:hypothetical protein
MLFRPGRLYCLTFVISILCTELSLLVTFFVNMVEVADSMAVFIALVVVP